MVSKARLDLPDPETPVITTSFFLGRVTSMDLRLCSLAPRTSMASNSVVGRFPLRDLF